MPSEESVIVLMAKTAIDKSAYHRALPGIDLDTSLFPEDNNRLLDIINN